MKKISVITLIYNSKLYIERCVRSLFSQTLRNEIEFIFVDDGSTDNSLSILEKLISEYPERENETLIIKHESNKGSAVARNTGLLEASGKYIIYCDSDDWVEPAMYEDMLRKAEINDADIVVCDYIGEFTKKSIVYRQRFCNNKDLNKELILSGKIHNGLCNKLIKRSILIDNKIYFTEGVNLWEDVSVICRVIYFCNVFANVEHPYYHYVQYNTASYTKRKIEISVKQILEATNIVVDFYSKIESPLSKFYISLIRARAFISCIKRANYSDCKKYVQEFSDIHNDDIIALELKGYDKLAIKQILDGRYILGKSLFTFKEKIRGLLR